MHLLGNRTMVTGPLAAAAPAACLDGQRRLGCGPLQYWCRRGSSAYLVACPRLAGGQTMCAS